MDRMSLQMRKNMTAIVEPYGLSHAHAIYLIALNLQDGQTMVGLSRFLDLDTANTNRVIKTLREKGFVYDDRKSESNKKFRIFLTDSGKALADMVMTRITELNNSYFANIPREDILNMRNTLIQVLNNMNLDIDEYMHSKYEDPFYTHLHLMPQVDGYESLSTRAPSRIVRDKE
ncbi:transcriptional regulator MarR family [methanogenic archaeon ISO4-H5]|jgi:DNA-binding MarR family transcriptional regulator|nr:transcriptional regulator MarR family [methanogenic archaeon ISO4-H5]MEE3363453.1 MarR family transcriptional regulator [Methanomethylophilus sp.]